MASSRSRSRSRSPLSARSRSRSPIDTYEIPDSPAKHSDRQDDNIDNTEFRRLLVTNAPLHWNWERLREYIGNKTQSPVVKAQLPHVSVKKKGEFVVRFSSSLPCSITYKELNGAQIDGRTLVVTPIKDRDNNDVKNKFRDIKPQQQVVRQQKKVIKTASFVGDQNTNETYGLSLNFLNSLGIKPPLINKIFVGNLSYQVDKEKLREVFGFAGTVVSVYILNSSAKTEGIKKSAKIEFDHPVEAVQAISMFHRQDLYGRALVVQMDQQPHTQSLPEGLASLGPGLGPNGEPLKGIRNLVEIQPLKQMLTQELSQLKANKSNEIAQTHANLLGGNSTSLLGNPMQNIMTPLNINTMGVNPLNSAAMFGVNVPLNQGQVPSWQGLLQQNMGNDLATTLAALQAHNVSSKNVSTFSQTLGLEQNKQRSSSSNGNSKSNYTSEKRRESSSDDKDRHSMTSSNMLVFNNLPPSVTVQALNNKMREIGEVMFAEITGQGRAIVRFQDNEDAERCVKIFDRSKVDGQTIEVKFF